jgi:Zn-dependent M28 family amino/carboxypeptidase
MQLIASTPASRPPPGSLLPRLQPITPTALRESVERYAIPRARGTEGHSSIRARLLDDLADALGPSAPLRLDEAGNVIAGTPDDARVLIGAHYDSVPNTPGADDNASALAALVAAARAIGPDAGVCLVAFDGEESGFLGSRAFVARHRMPRLAHVHILEMVGYASHAANSQRNPLPMIDAPTVGDFLAVVGSYTSGPLLRHVLSAADSHPIPVQTLELPDVPLHRIDELSPHLLRSDHAPFWWSGRPALMWTDTAEFRNPHYHQASDTPDTLDFEFLAAVTRLLAHAAIEAAR